MPPLAPGPVPLTLDDTLARKRGLKVFGTGMHHDPLASSRNQAVTSWGHSWVVRWMNEALSEHRSTPDRQRALPRSTALATR